MPRKHCTTRVRSRGHVRLNKDTRIVDLFYFSVGPEMVPFRTISQRQAEQMEEDGEAKRVYEDIDGERVLAGWQMTTPDDPTKRPPPAMLNAGTINAVANAKDSNLSRHERRQFEKFCVWPLVGDTKAVAVRPRISDADQRRAEAMLGRR